MKISLLVAVLSVFVVTNQSFAADLKDRHGRSTMARERTAAALEKKVDDKAMAQLKTSAEAADLDDAEQGKTKKLEARHGRAQMTRELAGKAN
jgi:hypothetical protein